MKTVSISERLKYSSPVKAKDSLTNAILKPKKIFNTTRLTVLNCDMLSVDYMECICSPTESINEVWKMSARLRPVVLTRLEGIKENLMLLTLNSMTMQRKCFSISKLTLNG